MNDVQKLFESPSLDGVVDGITLVDIDMEGIDRSSKDDALALVENLSKLYCNEEFMRQNPNFKKRVDHELESLRILMKMRKADEVAHDLIVNAIAGNSSNASLYKSLSEIQKTILSITKQMSDVITGLNTLLKGYQLEINFETPAEQEEESETPSKKTSRGSKEFIEMMRRAEEDDLFDSVEGEEGE